MLRVFSFKYNIWPTCLSDMSLTLREWWTQSTCSSGSGKPWLKWTRTIYSCGSHCLAIHLPLPIWVPSPCFIASHGRGMMVVLCQFQEVTLMSHSQYSKGKIVPAFCNAWSSWQHWKKTSVYPVVRIWARVRQHQWRWKTSKCCVTQVGKVGKIRAHLPIAVWLAWVLIRCVWSKWPTV